MPFFLQSRIHVLLQCLIQLRTVIGLKSGDILKCFFIDFLKIQMQAGFTMMIFLETFIYLVIPFVALFELCPNTSISRGHQLFC